MALEVGEDYIVVVVGKGCAHVVFLQPRAALHRQGHRAVLVLDLDGGDAGKAVLLRHLVVLLGGAARAAVGGVALHDGAVQLADQVAHQFRPQVVGGGGLPGGQLDRHPARRRPAQGLVGPHQRRRADLPGKIDGGGPGVLGQVLQRLQWDGVPLVGGQAGCPGGGGGAGGSCRAGRRRSRRCGRSAGRRGSAAGPGSPGQGCGSRKFEEIAPFHGSCLLCGMSLEGAGFGTFHCYHNT